MWSSSYQSYRVVGFDSTIRLLATRNALSKVTSPDRRDGE